jgi:hypothetical protein
MILFKSKSYGYAELACLYLPTLNKKSASNQLRNWIKKNGKLKCALSEAGVQNRQKIFTPKQVRIIIDHLGEP